MFAKSFSLEQKIQKLIYFRKQDCHQKAAIQCISIAGDYFRQEEYARAMQFYAEAVQHREVLGKPAGLSEVYTNIASTYDMLGDYKIAFEYYSKGLHYAREAIDRQAEVRALTNLGIACLHLKELEKALERLNESLLLAQQIGYAEGILFAQENWIEVKLALRQPEGVADILSDNKERKELVNDEQGVALSLLHEALLAEITGQAIEHSVALCGAALIAARACVYKEAICRSLLALARLAQHDKDQVRIFLLEAQDVGRKVDVPLLRRELLEALIDHYKLVGDPAAAVLVYEEYTQLIIGQAEHMRAATHEHYALMHRVKELQAENQHDVLLHMLYNRRTFMSLAADCCVKAKETQQPLTLVMIDIDHFKQVNDVYGHSIGDQVLLKVGELIKNAVRASDLVGRYGGEEFIAIFPHADPDTGLAIAEKIRVGVMNYDWSKEVNGRSITISVGVATTERFVQDLKSFYQLADSALYQAKQAGRNRSLVLLP